MQSHKYNYCFNSPQGFEFHHAEPGYVMLTQWLSDEESTIPANASHQIGVGALVLNDKDEVGSSHPLTTIHLDPLM